MDDQLAPGMDFGEWFFRWLDLVGECEEERGRMICDDISGGDVQEISQGAQRSLRVEESTVSKCGVQVFCDA